MVVVGYTMFGPDNDTHMFKGDTKAGFRKCEKCGYRVAPIVTNPAYVPRKTRHDLTSTYDGQWIVTEAFKSLCEREGYPGLDFLPFENDARHFHLVPRRQVKFDSARRKTRFERLCKTCNRYESVVGATPAYLRRRGPLPAGVFRSDLAFASGDEKSPLLLVGEGTRDKIVAARLEGIVFEPAFGLD